MMELVPEAVLCYELAQLAPLLRRAGSLSQETICMPSEEGSDGLQKIASLRAVGIREISLLTTEHMLQSKRST